MSQSERPKVLVDILGARFSLQADEDPIYLKSLISYYEDLVGDALNYAKIKCYSTTDDLGETSLKVAILAGILITDKLYKEKKKTYSLSQILNEKSEEKDKDSQLSKTSQESIKEFSSTKEDSEIIHRLMNDLDSLLKEF